MTGRTMGETNQCETTVRDRSALLQVKPVVPALASLVLWLGCTTDVPDLAEASTVDGGAGSGGMGTGGLGGTGGFVPSVNYIPPSRGA